MEKIDCFFNLFTTFSYLKLKTFHSLFKFQRFKLNIELLKLQFQGGQNFYEKIRTKIRTFSEEICTILSIFEKKSVQSVQFSEKNLYNPCIKKKCVHFLKIRTISTIFEKNLCNPYI